MNIKNTSDFFLNVVLLFQSCIVPTVQYVHVLELAKKLDRLPTGLVSCICVKIRLGNLDKLICLNLPP